MEVGFIGLGRMGLNMSIRLLRAGHAIVGFNQDPARTAEAARHGARPAATLEDLVAALRPPRVVWLMIPSGAPVDATLTALGSRLAPGDLVVDGGNSNWRDSRRRAEEMRAAGFAYVDCGTSGGIWGLELGYCMMLGGEPQSIERLRPVLDALAPQDGWRHVGPAGAGHFAKMVHNGIEYGMMQAYAEGFAMLKASPYAYDLAAVSHLWNQGSVVRSWLLELAERAFAKDPGLDGIRGWVEDSGEGRWTVHEAVDAAVPAPVMALSLFARFRSREEDSFSDRVLAALRNEFGGHAVKKKEA